MEGKVVFKMDSDSIINVLRFPLNWMRRMQSATLFLASYSIEMVPYVNPHRVFWRSVVKKVASDTECPPSMFTCQMQSVHGDSHISFVTAQTFLGRFLLQQNKWKSLGATGFDSEKCISLFGFTEWKNSLIRWQVQSPDSPAWHAGTAVLCLLLLHQ